MTAHATRKNRRPATVNAALRAITPPAPEIPGTGGGDAPGAGTCADGSVTTGPERLRFGKAWILERDVDDEADEREEGRHDGERRAMRTDVSLRRDRAVENLDGRRVHHL